MRVCNTGPLAVPEISKVFLPGTWLGVGIVASSPVVEDLVAEVVLVSAISVSVQSLFDSRRFLISVLSSWMALI